MEKAIHISREVGLQTIGYFMIGSPGETYETITNTIHFAKKLRLDFAQFAVTIPFPGTELYNLYLASGGEHIPWDNFIYAGAGQQVAPIKSQLSSADLQYWARRAYREFYLRPAYLWQRLRRITSIGELKVSLKGFIMLLRSIIPSRKKGAL